MKANKRRLMNSNQILSEGVLRVIVCFKSNLFTIVMKLTQNFRYAKIKNCSTQSSILQLYRMQGFTFPRISVIFLK